MTVRKRYNENKAFEPSQKVQNVNPKENKNFFQNPQNFFTISLMLRISSVLLTQTFFVPDEYWQSTEVAHRQVFGYGYLTWEWKAQIRSYLYPFIFEMYFQLLKMLTVDFYVLVRYGPHIIQAVLTAYYDISLHKLTLKITDNLEIANYSYYLNLMSWFLFYTGSRTLSNVAEMCFSTIGLSFISFGKPSDVNSLVFALLFGGIGCIIRPTCFLIWIPLVFVLLLKKEIHFLNLFKACFIVVPVLLVLLFGIDFYFYGSFTVVHWNFLQFNILENIGEFYGAHSWHWYLSQGLPVVFGVQVLFFIVGVFCSGPKQKTLLWISMFYIFVHSMIVHKEFRFLLPVVPILLCYAGQGFKYLSKYVSQRLLFLLVLLLNVPVALYFGLIHQRGTIDVLHFIRQSNIEDKDVLYLMPCHSTPYYSYLHQNITMRFLTCEPNTEVDYLCESDQFFENPLHWLHREFQPSSLIVAYDRLPKDAKWFLSERNYTIVKTLFHTHLPEGNIGNYINVYSR